MANVEIMTWAEHSCTSITLFWSPTAVLNAVLKYSDLVGTIIVTIPLRRKYHFATSRKGPYLIILVFCCISSIISKSEMAMI